MNIQKVAVIDDAVGGYRAADRAWRCRHRGSGDGEVGAGKRVVLAHGYAFGGNAVVVHFYVGSIAFAAGGDEVNETGFV